MTLFLLGNGSSENLGAVSVFFLLLFSVYVCAQCSLRREEGGHRTPWNCSYRQLWIPMWGLGIEPASLGGQSVLLTAEPFFFFFLVIWHLCSSLGCPWGLCKFKLTLNSQRATFLPFSLMLEKKAFATIATMLFKFWKTLKFSHRVFYLCAQFQIL